MRNVHVLPPDVIAKIAAGEVIDRPSSVVKELLENSLDAEATRIELTLADAGKSAITIRDNGNGIASEDLEHIFLRHATSKISDSDDLFDIHSLGFRGEALYAISAVADVRLQSRYSGEESNSDSDSGWQIHVRGGQQQTLEPCSFNGHGTEIEIRELFFNTPARKKFLKSNAAEISQIINIFTPYTLLHPNLSFKLVHQNKTLIDVAPATDQLNRSADVLNLNPEHLIAFRKEYPGELTFEGVLGDMNIRRTRRDLQFLSVNGRPVQSKNISFHVNQIYRLVMAPQEFPFFILNITLPPDELDVNIHPAKREVKIKNEAHVCSLLRRLIETTLMQQGKPKIIDDALIFKPQNNTNINHHFRRSETKTDNIDIPASFDLPVRETSSQDYAFPRPNPVPPTAAPRPSQNNETVAPWLLPPETPLEASPRSALHEKFANARYIGPFRNKFLLFENAASLLVVDQHAAQERIMYETFIRQMNAGKVEVQTLLEPVLISLTPEELSRWEESQSILTTLGFDNNQWDRQTVAVHSHPALITDIERAVRNILQGETVNAQDHDTLARRACKASVRAGDKLAPEQALHQRDQLLRCLDPFTCPHGRPTVIEMTEGFLDKQFART